MKHPKLTLVLLTSAAVIFFWPRPAPVAAESAPEPQTRRGRAQRRRTPARPRVDYSKFTHTSAAHRKESCDSCHKNPSDNWAKVRARDSAFPDITDYPEHASCLGCHRQQFFNGARPAICSVCHTVVSPRADERHPFANPAESFAGSARAKTRPREFALNFPHDLHQDVLARAPSPAAGTGAPRFVRAAFVQDAPKEKPNGCSVCHETFRPKPAAGVAPVLPDGLLKTTPTGHASCFNCHWQDGGEKPLSNDCAGCHKPLQQSSALAEPKGRDADRQFAERAGFTDPFVVRKFLRRMAIKFSHDNESHRATACVSCHMDVSSLNTLDERTLRVPILSCGGSGCHITTSGPKKQLNVEVEKRRADATFKCTFCHVNLGGGGEAMPKPHDDAVPRPNPAK